MTCDPRDILLYVDGELAPAEAARVLAHVAGCSACREALHAEQALDKALGGLADCSTPEDFADLTVARARCDISHAVVSPRERGRAAVFAASLAGASLVLLWPTGLGSAALAALAPMRCFSRFCMAWAVNSCTGAFIVGRTLSSHFFAEANLPPVLALVLLAALVALLGVVLVRFHRDGAAGQRKPIE